LNESLVTPLLIGRRRYTAAMIGTSISASMRDRLETSSNGI
jgi:hypothetical protein